MFKRLAFDDLGGKGFRACFAALELHSLKLFLAPAVLDHFPALAIRAKTCCAEMTEEGTPVRWIRSYFLPKTEETHCYFEGANADVIKEANERAQIPFTSVTEVVELSPEKI